MNCPRCKTDLTKEIIMSSSGSIEIDKCASCEGLWFDNGELSHFEKLIEPTLLEIKNIPSKEIQMIQLHCPMCEDHPAMLKRSHPRDKNVVIDYCKKCKGVWLDYGELDAIQKESYFSASLKIFKWLLGKE